MVEHPQVTSPHPTLSPASETDSERLDPFFDGPYALVVVLAVAALLASLNVMGAFGSDEVWSLHTVSKTFREMTRELRGDIHPPLYYWLLFPWTRMFGAGEFALRSLSGLFYLASVFALYRWGRQMGGARVGAIAAFVYLTSPLAILTSHLARMYALLSLLSILSTWLYWRLFDQGEPVEGKRIHRDLALFAIVNALGTLTHVWFFFLLFAEGVHWLALRRCYFVQFAGVMATSLAPYAVLWLPTLLGQLGKSTEAAAWILPPTLEDVGIVLFVYAGTVILLLPPAVWKAVTGRVRPYPWASGFTLILITALAVPFALSYIKPVFYSRFTIVGVHLFALVVAGGVARVSNWQLPAFVSAIALASAIYVAVQPKTCDARRSAEYLVAQTSAADSVVFTSLSRSPIDHYLRQMPDAPGFSETTFPAEIDAHPGYEGALFAPGRDVRLRQEAEELANHLRQRHGRIFFFRGFHPEIDAFLESALDHQFKRAESKPFHCGGTPCYYNAITVYQ